LRELEVRYAESLVVIGVHSAKFPAERVTEAVAQAVRRHNIRHPVVNDHEFSIWQAYACRAWPTLMFVDPHGNVIGKHEGEFEAATIARAVDQMLAEFDASGSLKRGVTNFGTTGSPGLPAPEKAGPLAFPGKVTLDTRGRGHIYISDSNHHRLVIMGLQLMDGAVHHIVGDGQPGLVDGPPEQARFNWPQGIAIDPRTGVVYIADTENHAIRRMSPAGGEITTVAGTGKQARSFGVGGNALETALSSPWDLVFVPDPDADPPIEAGSHVDPHDDAGLLYVAMAGTHQIWAMDVAAGTIVPFAGTGREALVDGNRDQACFAQPSGLSLDGERQTLYVADSETSAVRTIDLASGNVSTLVGAGLFEFGDVDGQFEIARLQHPLAVAFWGDDPDGASVLVADSYNHRIKKLDLAKREVRSFVGDRREPAFSEPGGLALGRGILAVGDTNNHRVQILDLATRSITTLEIDESRHAH